MQIVLHAGVGGRSAVRIPSMAKGMIMINQRAVVSRRSVLRRAALVTAGVVVAPLLGITELVTSCAAPAYKLQINGIQIAGPANPSETAAWLAAMRQWSVDQRAALRYDDGNYKRPELAWAQRNPIQPQAMVHDLYLYDRTAGRYTVEKYLADVEGRYGGIDSVLIWPTYPNIGVDDRNTGQMIRDMPGGIDGLRQMVADFHRAGVKVLFPIHPWDVGTRDPGRPWSVVLPETMAEIGADGLNGDTMRAVSEDYFTHAAADRNPLVLEPEIGLNGELATVQWNTQSWGYWNLDAHHQEIPFPYTPQVSLTKWLEPRPTVHVNDRWSTSKIDMLQAAFFNRTGLESWENIWGIWNQLTDRDQEANRSTTAATGDQLTVPYEPGLHYYDVYHGVELQPKVDGDTATLAFLMEPRGSARCWPAPPRTCPRGSRTSSACAPGGTTAEQLLGGEHRGDTDDGPRSARPLGHKPPHRA